jgi:two-component system CheB/CheR fusion protein
MDEGSAISIILTDLTDQKQAEQELKEKNKLLEEARLITAHMNEELEKQVRQRTHDLLVSREHFKFLADNIPVIVWTTDADGNIDYLNQKWFEYSGQTEDFPMAGESSGIIHPEDQQGLMDAWTKAKKSKEHFQYEFRLRRATDGSFRWHIGKAEPFFDNRGNLSGWFGTSTDIEDQRKELERKDEFIGVASHELKTPLTSLKGYIQLIEQQSTGREDLDKYLAKANHSLDKLQHLINDLLDVSKIQAGKLEFNRDRFDLSALLMNCVENSIHIYPAFEFRQEIEPGLIVCANAERIEQVFMNLISNAVKYSPVNKIIDISARKMDGHMKVCVKDRGIGLRTADQKKIFERFYRVEDNKYMASGLGMGLYISSEIIREHKGTMYVESTLNEGSSFYFTLPLTD